MKRDGTAKARALRRNLTDAERLLWRHLRSRQLAGAKFRRQFPVGSFVADFVCLEARLIIELDGGIFFWRAAFALSVSGTMRCLEISAACCSRLRTS